MRDVNEMNLPSQTIQKQLHFQVANLVVLNPTPKTIGIRVGSMDIPRDLNHVDLFVLPGSFVVYPVMGNEFALAFMNPQLAIQPSGMPTKAAVIFLDASEITPSFGAIALTTFSEILNDSISVTPGAPWPVLQSGDWNVDAVIQNATLNVTQSGLWTVNATIQNAILNVAQSGNWNVGQTGAWTVAATITNATLNVAQSGAWNVAANITNSLINVAQSGAWNINATIVNASINVVQSGAWTVTANISNATLNIAGGVTANITAVNVNLPVQNATGTTLEINPPADLLVRTEPAHALGTWNVTVSVVNAGGWSYRSLTLSRIHINVTRVTVTGVQSGMVYIDIDDMVLFQYDREFTFDMLAGLDTSITVATTASAATVTASWAIIGHRMYSARTSEEHGATRVRQIYDRLAISAQTLGYGVSLATHAAFTNRKTYTPAANVIAKLKYVTCSIDATTAADTARTVVDILIGANTIARVVDLRSRIGSVAVVMIACDLLIPSTGNLQFLTLNNDAAAKFFTFNAQIEEVIQ